jgi:hypothetical protein
MRRSALSHLKEIIMPKLDQWYITTNGDPYLAPELRLSVLCGKVYGSEHFEDGTSVTTSVVLDIDQSDPPQWAETQSGTRYELGDIDSRWLVYVASKNLSVADFVKPIIARKDRER